MFINEVIRLVRNFYPSEYDLAEMLIWCNEVSSMLTIEDRNIFKTVTLPVAEDGTILLPDGISMEYIENIISGGKLLNKKDFREYGHRKLHISNEAVLALPNSTSRFPSVITVEYLQPYEPIRLVKYRGTVSFPNSGEFKIAACEFIPGDILIFQLDTDTDDPLIIDNVPLLNVSYDPDNLDGYICTVPFNSFDGYSDSYDNAVITRQVTDSTVCDAPFDSMYIDYLLAKICYFQRDITSYNQHMTSFNSRLAAYRSWLISRLPKSDGKFMNWW